ARLHGVGRALPAATLSEKESRRLVERARSRRPRSELAPLHRLLRLAAPLREEAVVRRAEHERASHMELGTVGVVEDGQGVHALPAARDAAAQGGPGGAVPLRDAV